jgi:hypothetical protein
MVLVAALSDGLAATARAQDYEENFYSVISTTYDSDSDGYSDSVILEVDVDTTGDYVEVIVEAFLEDSYGNVVASDSAFWSIYGEEAEVGYFDFTVFSGDPGDYTYYLDLYDDFDYWEDEWYGSVYLYPTGYGTTSRPTATQGPFPTLVPFPTQGPFPTRTPSPTSVFDGFDGDGMDGDTVAGIVGAALLAVVAGLIWTSRNSRKNSRKRKVEKAPDARIAKLREQMERWRDEGYDVSELEDLFR